MTDAQPLATVREGDAAAFDRIMSARHSCRAFRPDPVPRATIEAILTTAQKTASWNNTQPWQVTIASGAARDRFRAAMVERASSGGAHASDLPFPRDYLGVYLDRRRACGFQLYGAVGIARGDKDAYRRQTLRNFELFDAPHIAIVTTDEVIGVYGAVDCGAYVSNFMSAAQAHGVGTIAQAALAVHADLVRELMGIPEGRQVVCGISFGFADTDAPVNSYRTPRASLEEAVRWLEE
ncbi:nitroreductase [Phreatobacter sp.]|uniref:nitroreductase n=1 Tax=Phreatobacter sp. TaxID=1966341 RepID=UPI003F6E901B